jgi:hypothetical protein
MIRAIIGGIAFASIPLLFGWLLVTGLQRGVIRARGANYSRATQPTLFWIVAAAYAALILFWTTIVGLAVVATQRYR